jgi:hypothetical protein
VLKDHTTPSDGTPLIYFPSVVEHADSCSDDFGSRSVVVEPTLPLALELYEPITDASLMTNPSLHDADALVRENTYLQQPQIFEGAQAHRAFETASSVVSTMDAPTVLKSLQQHINNGAATDTLNARSQLLDRHTSGSKPTAHSQRRAPRNPPPAPVTQSSITQIIGSATLNLAGYERGKYRADMSRHSDPTHPLSNSPHQWKRHHRSLCNQLDLSDDAIAATSLTPKLSVSAGLIISPLVMQPLGMAAAFHVLKGEVKIITVLPEQIPQMRKMVFDLAVAKLAQTPAQNENELSELLLAAEKDVSLREQLYDVTWTHLLNGHVTPSLGSLKTYGIKWTDAFAKTNDIFIGGVGEAHMIFNTNPSSAVTMMTTNVLDSDYLRSDGLQFPYEHIRWMRSIIDLHHSSQDLMMTLLQIAPAQQRTLLRSAISHTPPWLVLEIFIKLGRDMCERAGCNSDQTATIGRQRNHVAGPHSKIALLIQWIDRLLPLV